MNIMTIHAQCIRLIITTISLVLLAISAQGQIKISSDTISNCRNVNKINNDKFIIISQNEYEEHDIFRGDGEECLPFDWVDFDKNILVGYKYRGSNCDMNISWSAIFRKDDKYLIQFTTWPPQICRDLNIRIAWFLLTKPQNKIDILFERVFKQYEDR